MTGKTYTLHSTEDYHLNGLNTLGWELTVCNALHPEGTPLRKLLRRDDSYGHLLYDYLSRFVPMGRLERVLEIGGGYGYLMKDFLERNGALAPCMVDISPYLLRKQEESLAGREARFWREDFLKVEPDLLRGFDLAVLNENLGDFPAVTGLNRDILSRTGDPVDPVLGAVRGLYERYGFVDPEEGVFTSTRGP